NAAVRVDDERAQPSCTAPCDLELAPGQHQLFFSADGFRAPPRLVTVAARGQTSATAALSPLTGSILVEAGEPGPLVKGAGMADVFTPTETKTVPVGKRQISVTLRGFTPAQFAVDVEADQQAQPEPVSLTPLREVEAVSRYAEAIDDAPSSVTIISGEEIRAFGYPTTSDAPREPPRFPVFDAPPP